MRNKLRIGIGMVAVIGLAAVSDARAQSAPAVTAVSLTPQTQLAWNASPAAENVAGYWARATQGTNQWKGFTTNNVISLAALVPGIAPGNYGFAVSAVKKTGLEGPPATLSTNVDTPPSILLNLRVEVTATATLTLP
jgi:predicted phage tail protein